jgi:hypothetical protein
MVFRRCCSDETAFKIGVPKGIQTPVTAVKGRHCRLRPFALWSIAPLHLASRYLGPTDCVSVCTAGKLLFV